MKPSVRAGSLLAGFFALTVPLMPVQAAALALPSDRARAFARAFPNWYHRRLCRMLGIRIHVEGAIAADGPVLLIANHVSWLDIPVMSAVGPVSFIAKREVGTWPFVRNLARLQRSVFVDRERRLSVGRTTDEIGERLAAGDRIVLFAEGTSNDGNRVLPFRSALLGSLFERRGGGEVLAGVKVQTLAIAYTRLHGIAMDRFQRPLVAWYGDMEMAGHAWDLLKSGPLDVHIAIGEPLPLSDFPDRKALARHAETAIRAEVGRLLRPGTANG